MPIYKKKHRSPSGPGKNELRAARSAREKMDRRGTGTLRSRFQNASRVDLDLRLEASTGAELDHIRRSLGLDDPLVLNVPCPGGCGEGLFLLADAVEALLRQSSESREGMAICQAASCTDPKQPCGTRLRFRITISYDGPRGADAPHQ